MPVPHLLAAISSHGFGHVAQVAPVINALRRRLPSLHVTLRTAAPHHLLESRIRGPFDVQPVADDFGMVQTSALDVDVTASAQAYRRMHADWDHRVTAVAREIAAAKPDLVLANVPYLTLAAAAHAGIASVALCSLHWEAIYGHYCGRLPEAAQIRAQMSAAYASARWFLRPAPAMDMPALSNTRAIGPIAACGTARRDDIVRAARLRGDERLVLVAMGGIAMRLPVEQWPIHDGVRFIVPGAWQVQRPDVIALESLPVAFSDVLASCDLLLTKPGYGSFVEAAAAGVPVLYVPRGDWPEEPALVRWMEAYGRAMALTRTDAEHGHFFQAAHALWAAGRVTPVAANGAEEAAGLLADLLRR